MSRLPALCLVACLPLSAHAQVSQFRGPAGDGVSAGPALAKLSEKSVAWTVPVPGFAIAQPALAGGSLFVLTAAKPDPAEVARGDVTRVAVPDKDALEWRLLSLDPATGSTRWSRSLATKRPPFGTYPGNGHASETPAADAERVVVHLGAVGLTVSFDHQGNERWRHAFEPQKLAGDWGTAASPVLAGGRVFLQHFGEREAKLWARDAATGELAWEVARPSRSRRGRRRPTGRTRFGPTSW